MLALGVILASDVFKTGVGVETLLFGSLLLVEPRDLVLAGVASAGALAATLTLGPGSGSRRGFDPGAAGALGVRGRLYDGVLLALVALVVVAALSALGALLVAALVVVPAATVRLWTDRLVPWQAITVALVAAEGIAGLALSVELNAPPGATIAALAGRGVRSLGRAVTCLRVAWARGSRPRWRSAPALVARTRRLRQRRRLRGPGGRDHDTGRRLGATDQGRRASRCTSS